MDVRCEKCQTEYELDESKLKPGGVTVKCTTCGHMFKVRARPAGQDDVAAPASPASPPDRFTPTPNPTAATSPSMVAARPSTVLTDGEEGERTWLIRLEDGEIKTCRELSTLQKWIVSGRVSRSCSISRTGKKWKLLGEIGELASFFGIADEAREARVSGRWSAASRDGGSGAEDSFVGAGPMDFDRAAADASAGDEQPSTTPYGDAVSDDARRDGAGSSSSSTAGSFVRTLPLGGAALPPAARSHNSSHEASQMAAQAEPSAQDLPVEPGDHEPDSEEDAHAHVDEPVAQPSTLGHAPTLPPYGAGMLDEVPGTGSGAARRPSVASAGLPLSPPPSRPSPTGAPAGPVTGGWATRGQAQGGVRSRDNGPTGPTGGMRGGKGDESEAAFVGGGRMPNVRGEFENGRFLPTPFGDEEPLIPPRNRTGLWVILFSLIVMAGAAGTVYLFLYTGQADDDEEAAPAALPADAAVATATAPTTAPPTEPPPAPAPPSAAAEMEKLVADADAALLGDSQEALEPLGQQLSALASGAGGESAASPGFLIARARIETALGQQLADRSKLAASPAEARKLTEQAKARARTAHQLAEQALSLQADSPGALVALADARRLEGDRTIEVERVLKRATQNPASADLAREGDLVLALLRVRDNRLRDARVLLDKLLKTTPPADVRARFRVAWVDYLDANADAAVGGAETVLKAQPQHTGARALLDKIGGAKPPVDPADPMPPEEAPAGGKSEQPVSSGKPVPGKKPAEGGSKPDKGVGGDSYDAVLSRAEKLAENGNCGGAMPLYRKVLDMNPASVEALTGLGYCHMDRREFASAHTRFRAALGISSRYQPAMWGIAEAYQRQGLKEQALERFEAFVSEHPSSSRAEAARTRIENLKREVGESGGTSNEGGTGTGTPTTPPDESGTPPSEPSNDTSAPSDPNGSSGGSGGSGSETPGGGSSGGGGTEARAGEL